MPAQQRLIRLQIGRLKNLTDVTIPFDEQKRLTAILGPNGFGKSSILHALAASFRPLQAFRGEDRRYIDYFPNTPHGTWSNTNFDVVHYFREGTNEQMASLHVSKGIRQWLPLATKRPEREIYFIGVSTSVPAIEEGWPRSKIRYTTSDLHDAESMEIREKAGYILNRDYTRYHANRVSSRSSLIGVEFQGVNYSALSMGAGEQRLFKILHTIKAAGNYSLILIDEIDLLLHTDALHRLLGVINEYATAKKLQIVFTTHREIIVNLDSFIAVRHIYRSPIAPYKTFCFEETKPDALTRLTGHLHRPLSICCEDDVASAIVEKVAHQVRVRKFLEISCFGAADNCFTLAAALKLNGENLGNSLLVLDGDKYSTAQERTDRIRKSLTGDSSHDQARRDEALSKIVQFSSPNKRCPEQELHAMITSQQPSGDNSTEDEVIMAAHNIAAVDNPHDYLDDLIEVLGDSRAAGLRRVVEVAARAAFWNEYTGTVKAWLEEMRPALVEEVNA